MTEEGFKYSILASGSSGILSTLRRQRKTAYWCRAIREKITGLLAEIDRKPEDLDAILITHEHSDHIHGVGVLARKYGMDLYANEATWKAMEGTKYLGKVDDAQKHIFEMGKTKTFGDIDIESFGVSHDAAALNSIALWRMARASSCWRIRAMWWSLGRASSRMRMDIWLSPIMM